MSYIELKNVNASYFENKEEIVALANINLNIEKETINVVTGPSGSGKTTFLRLFIDQVDYEGTILLDGKDINPISFKKRNFSYVSQECSLNKNINIFDNIAFPLKIQRVPEKEIIERVVAISKLFNIQMCLSRKPRHISRGQQQRAEIAKALVKNPTLCLMDESLNNLDIKIKEEIVNILKACFKENKTTVIYVTHDSFECQALADNMIEIKDGTIINK